MSLLSPMTSRRRRSGPVLIAVVGAIVLLPLQQSVADGTSVSPAMPVRATADVLAFTAPIRTASIAATTTGRIIEVACEEGREVRAGDLLIRMDDAVQRSRTEFARLRAESTLEIELARVRHGRAIEELARLEGIPSQVRPSAHELSQARAAVEEARLAVALAERDRRMAVADHETQQRLLEEHQIRAPFDGYVSRRMAEVGDTIEADRPVLTLVQLNPLIVSCDCPIAAAAGLRAGQRVLLNPQDEGFGPREAVVRWVSRVAEAGSQTVRVRIEIPNQDGAWIAGLKVRVDFGRAALAAAGAGDGAMEPLQSGRSAQE
ncbi:MAG: efflux RND transporter periplasmic adaptor subunit [Phycisphaerales bacterium]|nr:efflux RND transporter periplasmic adaptor subunit [Phycisphaerales bacterium]